MPADPGKTHQQMLEELADLSHRVLALEAFRSEYERARWHLQRLAVLLRDSNDAINVTDAAGQILEWNAAAERMYGYTEAEAQRMNIAQLIPDALAVGEERHRADAWQGTTVAPYQTQRLTKSGLLLHVLSKITKLAGLAGRQDSLSAIEQDLTSQKRAEALETSLTKTDHLRRAHEDRIVGLGQEVNRLCQELGRPQPYPPTPTGGAVSADGDGHGPF
jgi:PAS domain S-box-containing protein